MNRNKSKDIGVDKALNSINLKRETEILLKKLKLALLFSILIILLIYTLIDVYLLHGGDLSKTIFTLNFHEFWTYLIILIFFVFIYFFGSVIVKKQVILDLAIKESEEKYLRLIIGAYDLFSGIQDGIVVLDNEFNIIHVNPTIEKWYSHKKQLIGKKCYEIYENRDEICENCPNLSLIEDKVIKSKIHVTYDKNNNENSWLEVFSFPLFNQDNSSIIGIINYCKNITEKIKAEQIILEENKKLQELNQFRKNLITRVSHELKTPLNSIQSTTQHLLSNYKNKIDPQILRFIATIHQGGLRLTTLVENILDASMIESGKLILNKEDVNLSEIVQKCIDEIIFLAIKRNLTLKSDLPEILMLEIDPIRIEQVIINLLSNAIKNTPPEGKIHITANDSNNHIDLKIKDTGIGLTKEEIGKLFTPFGKIERYGKNLNVDIEGTGIGLYLSKEIVELHGGKIFLESQGRNFGSTFILRLFKT
ncbi:MAG: PAS domain-containing sensor histidine kinase [Promethearchaeota archaeon]|nr:MAG: PAS domain-containing sensor histidine kinase [Candidatus Lokiarchaeota archaeon]